ncbi:MAG: YceD family protein [Verrucomicrobiota bacterium]|jgi:uncharacterized metal-binding protein YceD (DUF177 family)
MALIINLRHLEKDEPLELTGELPPEELDLQRVDEMIQVTQPLRYELEATRLGANVLVQGTLRLRLNCECVRCLKSFHQELVLEHHVINLPLEGEEAVRVDNDCVDLTPYVREDILLAFPQHPLCETECSGLPKAAQTQHPSGAISSVQGSAAWDELNKLKF